MPLRKKAPPRPRSKKEKEARKFIAAKAILALEDIGKAKVAKSKAKRKAATKTAEPIRSTKGRRKREKDLLDDL